MKKILAILLACLMLVACFAGCAKDNAPANDASATDVVSDADVNEDTTGDFAEGVTVNGDGEYYAFLAIGADLTANDWAYQWAGDEKVPCAGVKATAAKVNEGDTFTVAIEFAAPSVYTWYVAPSIIVGEGKVVDATVNAVRINGKDVTGDVDFAADDKAFWYEGTGNFTAEECVRLAGGYNEWGTKYIANSPADYSSIEYEITLNSVKDEADVAVSATDAPAAGSAIAYIMYADESWTNQYWYDGNEYTMKSELVEITGEGDYSVALTCDTPAQGLAFTALGIDGGEAAFPNYCFTITAMSINGQWIEFAKPYTSSDDGLTTRSNIYNAWVSALPDDARCAYGDLADCTWIPADPADFVDVTEFKVYFTVTAPGVELDYEAKVTEIRGN